MGEEDDLPSGEGREGANEMRESVPEQLGTDDIICDVINNKSQGKSTSAEQPQSTKSVPESLKRSTSEHYTGKLDNFWNI